MHPGLGPEDCERCAGPLVSNRRPAEYWNAEDGRENEFAHLGVRFGGSGIELVPEVFQQRRLGDSDGPGDFRHGDAIARHGFDLAALLFCGFESWTAGCGHCVAL